MRKSNIERFWEKTVEGPNGCINWSGGHSSSGYSVFCCDGRDHKAHRWIYEYKNGEIDKHGELHHSCKNRGCVNTEHMSVIGHKEHMSLRRQSHCYRGHELDYENTSNRKDGKGRYCKECKRINSIEDRRKLGIRPKANVIIEYNGVKMNQRGWEKHIGLKRGTIYARIKLGYSTDRILSPINLRRKP